MEVLAPEPTDLEVGAGHRRSDGVALVPESGTGPWGSCPEVGSKPSPCLKVGSKPTREAQDDQEFMLDQFRNDWLNEIGVKQISTATEATELVSEIGAGLVPAPVRARPVAAPDARRTNPSVGMWS